MLLRTSVFYIVYFKKLLLDDKPM